MSMQPVGGVGGRINGQTMRGAVGRPVGERGTPYIKSAGSTNIVKAALMGLCVVAAPTSGTIREPGASMRGNDATGNPADSADSPFGILGLDLLGAAGRRTNEDIGEFTTVMPTVKDSLDMRNITLPNGIQGFGNENPDDPLIRRLFNINNIPRFSRRLKLVVNEGDWGGDVCQRCRGNPERWS